MLDVDGLVDWSSGMPETQVHKVRDRCNSTSRGGRRSASKARREHTTGSPRQEVQ